MNEMGKIERVEETLSIPLLVMELLWFIIWLRIQTFR